MSYEEFCSWQLYRNARGPLALHQRVDRIGAIMAVRMSGGKMEDYMPWSGEIKYQDDDDVKNKENLSDDGTVNDIIKDEFKALRDHGISVNKDTSRTVAMRPNYVLQLPKDEVKKQQKQTKQERVERLNKLQQNKKE